MTLRLGDGVKRDSPNWNILIIDDWSLAAGALYPKGRPTLSEVEGLRIIKLIRWVENRNIFCYEAL